MSAKNEQTLRRLVSSIKQADRAKTSGYDTQATVRRIEDGVAWVHIPGGVDETPVKLTIAANPGDTVQVRVAGGRAFLVGNATAPPTDDKVANNALNVARRAGKHVDHIQRMIDNGELNGVDGLGVVAVIPEYCLANARVIPEGGTFEDIQYTPWSEEVPEYVEGKFFWMRTATYYTDESVSYSDPIFDMASQVVVEARIAADNAEGAASTASGIANQALGKASATEKHFWSDSSGVHVSDVENSVGVGSNSQTISSDGTVLMRNGKVISSWTGDSSSNAAINFYDCTRAAAAVGDLIASYGRAGITQYINNIVAMALTASGLSFYTPDSDHNLQAVFGPSGTNLYVAGLLAMALASGSLKFYADDGVTELADFSKNGLNVYGSRYNETTGNVEQVEIAHLGLGETSSEAGTSIGEYYTIGTRNTGNVGWRSISIGFNNLASGNEGSTAVGAGNNVSGAYGMTFGNGLRMASKGVAIGSYNNTSHDFVVGIGTDSNHRKDGLYMDQEYGDLHVYNNIIPGGDQFKLHSVTPSAVSVVTGTWVEVAYYSFDEAGTYLVVYGAAFATNATGYRQLHLYGPTSSPGRWSPSISAVSGEQTRFSGSDIVVSSGVGDFVELRARQNSGGNLDVYGWIKVIKIGE